MLWVAGIINVLDGCGHRGGLMRILGVCPNLLLWVVGVIKVLDGCGHRGGLMRILGGARIYCFGLWASLKYLMAVGIVAD